MQHKYISRSFFLIRIKLKFEQIEKVLLFFALACGVTQTQRSFLKPDEHCGLTVLLYEQRKRQFYEKNDIRAIVIDVWKGWKSRFILLVSMNQELKYTRRCDEAMHMETLSALPNEQVEARSKHLQQMICLKRFENNLMKTKYGWIKHVQVSFIHF